MTVNDHIDELEGKEIIEWDGETKIEDGQTVFRISLDYEDENKWTTWFAALLDDPKHEQITGIVVGPWFGDDMEMTSEEVVEAIAAASDKLPNLRAIFLGDIIYEESEISWLHQSDVSPLLNAYPKLEYLTVRGGEGLSLGKLDHANLKTLIVQTGGLDRAVVKQIAKAKLPNLEHLELWLGDENYGANTTIDDLQPFFKGDIFPRLKYLGLCDSQMEDEIAVAVAKAPVLEKLEMLDLSRGTLSDGGAAALVASPSVAKLKKLDVHYNYLSEGMIAQLEQLGIEVDASESQLDDAADEEDRYVAVAE